MKIVIIGCGKTGRYLAETLFSENQPQSGKHDITLIDQKESALQRLRSSVDLLCVEGDGADAAIQREARCEDADLVIAVTDDDVKNILCCLLAKQLGAQKTIARVRTPEYYAQMELLRDALGLTLAINPERAAAEELARVLLFPAAEEVEVFEKGRLELVQVKLPDLKWVGSTKLSALCAKMKVPILICAVQRGNEVYIPDGSFILQAGDRIHIAATRRNLEKFLMGCGLEKGRIHRVLIVGGGRVGYYLATQLQQAGMRVKIIEQDEERCKLLAERLPKAVILQGDGTDEQLLQAEGIENADAFVCLTGIDEENIIAALYAKNVSDAKIVLRINRENFQNIAENLGLDCVVTPHEQAAENILGYVRATNETDPDSEIDALYRLLDDQIEAIEFRVKKNIPGLTGLPLREVHLLPNLLIGAIIRRRDVIYPNGETVIQVDDRVVIFARHHHFSSLRDIVEA